MKDAFRGPIKAGLAALFAVGLLLLLLNPPSLSGAEGLAVFVGGGLALLLLTAWATVALAGRDGMAEHEFERLVRRSEELAAQPDRRATEFDLLVAEAIDVLPEDFPRLLDTTPVVVGRRVAEHRAYGDDLRRHGGLLRLSGPEPSWTRTPSSATSAGTPIYCARRWSGHCAMSWPTTWAGASRACASGALRPPRRS